MSNEIEVRGKAEILPTKYSFEEMQFMAASVAKSNLYRGTGFENADQVLALMMLCEADGLHPVNAVRRYDIIKGRPTMKSATIQAEFQAKGGLIRDREVTREGASARFIHPVHSPAPGELISFTIADAKAAGVYDTNPTYKKYPEEMFWWRCVAKAVRRIMPGIMLGINSPEEIQDMEWQPAPTTVAVVPPPSQFKADKTTTTPPPAAQPDAVQLLSQPADGRDDRPYHKVVTEETAEYKGLAWRGHKVDIELSPIQVANHVRKWAAKEWPDDAPPDASDKKASSTWSQKRYTMSRDAVRAEIARYLHEKYREAVQAATGLPLAMATSGEMTDDELLDTFAAQDEPGANG